MYILMFQVNVSSTNTMETIHGLTPFITYTCTLHVVTLSDGPLSDPIMVTTAEHSKPDECTYVLFWNFVLHVAPIAPVMKDLTAIDSESVRVEWNKPEVNYGIMTTYTIYYSIENGSERSLIVPSNGQDVSSDYVFSITGALYMHTYMYIGTVLCFLWNEAISTDYSDRYCYQRRRI